MTLENLIATEEDFGSELAFMREMVDRYNETNPPSPAEDATEVYLAEARADIRRDLANMEPYSLTWSGWTDSLAESAHGQQWRHLVAMRQVYLAYRLTQEGPDSLNYRLMRDHENAYKRALTGLPSLVRGTGGAVTTSFRIQM